MAGSKKSTKAKAGKVTGKARIETASDATVAAFDIKEPKLPAAIDEAAFASGDFPYAKKM